MKYDVENRRIRNVSVKGYGYYDAGNLVFTESIAIAEGWIYR